MFKEEIPLEETETFDHIQSTISLLNLQGGEIIFEEGDQGEYFYIILEGEVEILKSSKLSIKSARIRDDVVAMRKDKRLAYFNVFKEYYEHIFWRKMDITKKEMDDILGLRGRAKIEHMQFSDIKRDTAFDHYIEKHENSNTFMDS